MELDVKSRGAGKRLTEDRRAAETGSMNDDQFEFILAVEEYKHSRNQTYVSVTQMLEIALYLGYRKIAEKGEYRLDRDKENNLKSGTKLCNACKKVLPLSEFNLSSKSSDGTEGSCSQCKETRSQAKKSDRRISQHLQGDEDVELA